MFLVEHRFIPCLVGQTDLITDRSEPHIRIVLTQQDTILSTRGEHTVRLIYTLRDKVIYQDSDICLVSTENERGFSAHCQCGVNSGHKTLGGRFLITGGTVHLAGHIEPTDYLRFQTVTKIRGVEKVIFNRISRTEQIGILQGRNMRQCIYLHTPGHRTGESVYIVFPGFFTFRLQEQLVGILVGKCDEFRLYAWAISRTNTLNLTVIHRRFIQSRCYFGMNFRICPYYPAGSLPEPAANSRQIRKLLPFQLIAILTFSE